MGALAPGAIRVARTNAPDLRPRKAFGRVRDLLRVQRTAEFALVKRVTGVPKLRVTKSLP